MFIRGQLYARHFVYVLAFYHPVWGSRCYYPDFIAREGSSQRSNLPRVTQLVTGRARLSDSKVHTVKHYAGGCSQPQNSANSISSKPLDLIPISKPTLAESTLLLIWTIPTATLLHPQLILKVIHPNPCESLAYHLPGLPVALRIKCLLALEPLLLTRCHSGAFSPRSFHAFEICSFCWLPGMKAPALCEVFCDPRFIYCLVG